MSHTDAAAAVAAVARLIQPAGPDYVRWNLRITAGGDGAKSRRDLATDLEWLAIGPAENRFDPQRRAEIRQAAEQALDLLPVVLDEDFFTNVKAAINGDAS